MNPEAEAVLKKILEKTPEELTENDKGFLKARWSYVGKTSRAKFEAVLKEKKSKEKVEEETKAEENTQVEQTPGSPYEAEVEEDEDVLE